MKRPNVAAVIGVSLILVGLLSLLQNLGLFHGAWRLLVALFFAGGGAAFLWLYISYPAQWWSLIPGFALLGIGGIISLDALAPRLASAVGGGLFLGSIGLAFWLVYLFHREHWWAVIPAGVLCTLAIVATLGNTLPGPKVGGVFFLGLALTFLVLSLVPTPEGRLKWALIPAGALCLMGLALVAEAAKLIAYVLPLALILLGIWLLLRVARAPA